MATGEGRMITPEDIERVQDLIERCILDYMQKKDIIDFLYKQKNIEPCFTRILWQCLEKQNENFFRNYFLRLALKDQITRFNNILEQQATIMKQTNSNEVVAFPPMQPIPVELPSNGLNHFVSLGLQRSSDYPFNTSLAQNPNNGMIEKGTDNMIINTESVNLHNSAYVSSSNNMDSNSHQLQRTFTDELPFFHSPHPDSFYDSNDVTINNQGTSTSRKMQVEGGSL